MSAFPEEVWAQEPEPSPVGALSAPRCRCRGIRLVVEGLCARCGREIRPESVFSRDFQRAQYKAALSWAAGEGLCRRTGFRGLADELGPNPPLEELHEALTARVAALPAPEALQVA